MLTSASNYLHHRYTRIADSISNDFIYSSYDKKTYLLKTLSTLVIYFRRVNMPEIAVPRHSHNKCMSLFPLVFLYCVI